MLIGRGEGIRDKGLGAHSEDVTMNNQQETKIFSHKYE